MPAQKQQLRVVADDVDDRFEAEIVRLRGQRHARLEAANAQAARLAMIDESPVRDDTWSRAEIRYWEGRGGRAARRAADDQHARWEEQLRRNEPARRKLEARISDKDEQRAAVAERHRAEIAQLAEERQKLADELQQLEAVPPLEEFTS